MTMPGAVTAPDTLSTTGPAAPQRKTSRLLTKVLIAEVVLFTLIGLATSAMSAYSLATHLTSEFASKGTAIATSIANASDELILTRDASTIQSLVDQYRQIRGVGYVFVVDGEGQIVSHTFVPEVPVELRTLRRATWNEPGGDSVQQVEVAVAGGGDYLDISAPVLAGVAGAVHVGMDRGVIRADITATIVNQLLVVGAILLFAVIAAATFIGRIAKPLSALTAHANQVARQNLDDGFEPDERTLGPLAEGRDETGELARAFLAMERAVGRQIARLQQLAGELAHYNETLEGTVADRTRELSEKKAVVEAALEDLKQAQDQIVRQEKMASLGALTAGIAHEIKNPLNFVNNFADLARELAIELKEGLAREGTVLDPKIADDVPDILDQLDMNLSKIKEHGVRADGIVRGMLLHSRGTSGQQLQATDINALGRDAVNLAYHGMRANDQNFNVALDFVLDADAAAPIDVIPQDLMRAFLNIANNACYAAYRRKAGPGGRVALTTRKLADGVEVRIRDNGDGIPESVRARIFEPFFTTKPAGQGTGLGLSICHDIVTGRHGGKMDVETEPGKFTEFIIVLPNVPPNRSSNVR
jgi:two-component system NtrC family sensor kinase